MFNSETIQIQISKNICSKIIRSLQNFINLTKIALEIFYNETTSKINSKITANFYNIFYNIYLL